MSYSDGTTSQSRQSRLLEKPVPQATIKRDSFHGHLNLTIMLSPKLLEAGFLCAQLFLPFVAL